MHLSALKSEIEALSPNRNKGKPHKIFALLAVLEGIDRNIYTQNCFYYDEPFRRLFTYYYKKYACLDDKNRPLAPFYYLKSFSFWKLKVKEGKNIQNAGNHIASSKKSLSEFVDYAYFDHQFYHYVLKKLNRQQVKNQLISILNDYKKKQNDSNHSEQKEMNDVVYEKNSVEGSEKKKFSCIEGCEGKRTDTLLPNDDFINYLNSLHNVTPANENALAEAQAQNSFFGSIHVSLELTDLIKDYLTSIEGKHVILTGHAGDGKSTIGLELYKKLIHHPIELPLNDVMQPEELIALESDLSIHLIKDMSEISFEDRLQIIDSACKNSSKERYFLISNTGNLLTTLKEYVVMKNENWLDFENKILSLLQKDNPSIFKIDNTEFVIINLAQINNLSTISELFDKLFEHTYWEKIDQCPYKDLCPIAFNIRAIKESYATSKDRTLSVYRFLNEYGHRLTLRQVTAHLAFSITGSLHCQDISKYSSLPSPPEISESLFHNNFFGFKGVQASTDSRRLIPIQKINTFSMGSRPYPPLERMLWFDQNAIMPKLPKAISNVFENLKNNIKEHKDLSSVVSESLYRNEIRRFLFLYGDESLILDEYLPIFIGSQMLFHFIEWQKDNSKLPNTVLMKHIERQVLHVLQEQYTGINLPESCGYHYLFITLRRNNLELRQSVQILSKKIPITNFKLIFEKDDQASQSNAGKLVLYEQVSNEKLILDLPFLDFVMMRNTGEIGQKLNMSYIDRLERFKNLLLASDSYNNESNLELLEYNSTGKLKTHKFSFNEDILEVTDVY